jgi:hypothetical protein
MVKISAAESGAEIGYTRDGTIPDEHSPRFKKPFTHIPAGTIRARTFLRKGNESAVTTAELSHLPAAPPQIVVDRALIELPGKTYAKIVSPTPESRIYYSLDGSIPSETSLLYKKELEIRETATIRAIAIRKGWSPSSISQETVFFTLPRKTIYLIEPYDERYPGGGMEALIDNIRGSDWFRHPAWQGFEARDFQCVIDLGKRQRIKRIILGCLNDQKSWIFLPEVVTVYYSDDNSEYKQLKQEHINAREKDLSPAVRNIPISFQAFKTRYLKIQAGNIMKCPEWHNGAGGKTWLFIDEVIIE